MTNYQEGILGSAKIKEMITEGFLVKDYLNLEEQLQPAGFDLTIKRIQRPMTSGMIKKNSKILPDMVDIMPLDIMRLKDGKDIEGGETLFGWFLPQGSYLAFINEEINLPKGIASICIQRSSLARSSTFHPTSFWDPGYNGKGTVALLVDNECGMYLEKDARAVQMIFYTVVGEAFEYNGNYQKENI